MTGAAARRATMAALALAVALACSRREKPPAHTVPLLEPDRGASGPAGGPSDAARAPATGGEADRARAEEPPDEPAPGADLPGRIEDPSGVALVAFFEGLRLAEAGGPEGRVLIAQFGDSHTAGDVFTGYVRRRLQQRFGDAGRGFLLPGKPMRHYYQKDAEYGTEGEWIVHRGTRSGALEPFGLAGVRVTADDDPHDKRRKNKRKPIPEAWVATCAGCPAGQRVSRFEIFYWKARGGGRLEYRVDDGPWQGLDTRADPDVDPSPAAYHVVQVPDGPHRLSLRPGGGGPVSVFGVVLERTPPGVVVDALGIVGAQAMHLHAMDWRVIGEHLARRVPRLVILQYGTNEVDNPHLDLVRFETQLVELIQRIKTAVPGVSVLVLGPPDMGVRERRDCDPPKRKPGKGKKPARARPEPPPPDPNAPPPPGCEWKTPAILPQIIEAERRAARRAGAAFFDLFTAMGGPDKMDEFWRQEPRLAYRDHVHLTAQGYELAAQLFVADLLALYDAWKDELPAAPSP